MIFKKIYEHLCKSKAKKICHECGKYVIGDLLDIGAGRCYISKEISKRLGINVQCLDIKDHSMTNLPLKLYDGNRIPFKDNTFNTVLLCYVLHHTSDPISVLKEAVRVSKKRIIIFEDDASNMLTKPLDLLFNTLHGVETPLNFKTLKGWTKIFKKLNLEIVRTKKNVEKEWFYPGVDHIMFILDKKIIN